MGARGLVLFTLAAVLVGAGPATAATFDPVYEAKNFSKTQERFRYLVGTPGYQVLLRQKSLENEAETVQIQAGDPERHFEGQVCFQKLDGCAGEVRAYDWATRGAGVVLPVSWTARNGSVISGHVWATAGGPAKRPGVVLTTGSVQAPEELYWLTAQVLAKAGYVVLTWDVQGQGYSDTLGEGADAQDGVPSQAGEPFYDQTEDALDFFESDAGAPYAPRPSCSSATSHIAKQRRRVAAGLASAYDPLASLLDVSRVGLMGHSLGASAVSYVGELDPRVKAIVAFDNLAAPTTAPAQCRSGSSPRPDAVSLTKPSLGISNDYGLTPQPNTSLPDPDAKTAASHALSAAGVDSMELVIRGGTHYESSVIPNPAFGGSLRGNDLIPWYTLAWFDKFLRGDPTADARLLTDRWRADAPEAAVDPDGDGNMLSRYYRSRVDLHTAGGQHVVCEDLRAGTGCGLGPDGTGTAPYTPIDVVRAPEASKDGPGADAVRALGGTSTTRPAGATGAPPAANRSVGVTPGGAGCRDALAPVSRFTAKGTRITRRTLTLRGTSVDPGCGGARGAPVAVTVSVARAVGARCRFLRPDGTFGSPTSCLRTTYLPATGTSRWSFTRRAPFPRGRYKLFVRGVDADGNVERKARGRTNHALRLR